MLDLARPRDLGDILGTCFELYGKHFSVFAALALAVVVPMDLITLGVIDGRLTSGFSEAGLFDGGTAYSITQLLITVPLITGGHVAAVRAIGEGRTPSVGGSLAAAGAALPSLIGVVVIYAIGVGIGTILVIVPGVFLYVRWFVATQAVVAEDHGPFDALERSWTLVADNWWRTLGIGIVLGFIAGLIGVLAGGVVSALAAAADSGPLLIVGTMLFDAIILSFSALGGTLLFFDLRARREREGSAPSTAAGEDLSSRPEAPPSA